MGGGIGTATYNLQVCKMDQKLKPDRQSQLLVDEHAPVMGHTLTFILIVAHLRVIMVAMFAVVTLALRH